MAKVQCSNTQKNTGKCYMTCLYENNLMQLYLVTSKYMCI